MKHATDWPLALVIGGTSGIGAAIARRFGRAGYRVVVSGRDAARGEACAGAIRAEEGEASFAAVDVASRDSIENLAARLTETLGSPRILVNAAGILQSGKAVLDQADDEAAEVWKVNYGGTLTACQIFGRQMREAKAGVILNIGSLGSLAPLSLPAYTPGKAAIWSLTQLLAGELGPHNIRVNAIAPGYTLSDGLKQKIAQGLRNPEAILESTALRRFVMPEEVAEAAHFLCSDLAASITGIILPVDAGWLVQAPYATYIRGNPIAKSPG